MDKCTHVSRRTRKQCKMAAKSSCDRCEAPTCMRHVYGHNCHDACCDKEPHGHSGKECPVRPGRVLLELCLSGDLWPLIEKLRKSEDQLDVAVRTTMDAFVLGVLAPVGSNDSRSMSIGLRDAGGWKFCVRVFDDVPIGKVQIRIPLVEE